MKPIVGWALAVAASLVAVPLTANAQYWEHDRWHGDGVRIEFHDHWRAGGWHHGWHGDRLGWWWVTGGMWYYYAQPVYPYPDPYAPPAIIVEQAPPPVVIQQAPAPVQYEPAPAATPPTAQFWYYCETPAGYYPYVASCPSGWKTVPATPPGAPK